MTSNPLNLTIKDIIIMYYHWEYDPYKCDVFYYHLISAIKTADPRNRKRIDTVYPNFVYVFNLWSAAGDFGNDLFREYKVGRFSDDKVIDLM